ncbi:MAG TPA: SMP-30/gluconolactonase/LRE family protein [Candidatus Eisenbacteria bacterium]
MIRTTLGVGVASAVLLLALAAAEPSGVVTIERLDPGFDRLVPRGTRAERVAGGFAWVEGPVWDAASGALLFSDVPNNVIHRWSEAGGVTTELKASGYSGPVPFSGREPGSNGLAFDSRGRLLICRHGDRRVVRREIDGTLTVLADRYQGRRLNSPNDLIVRPNGDIWFTDPVFGLPGLANDPGKELSFQGVYRLTPDGTLTAMVTDLEGPNGIGFSPDGRTLYVSNSDPRHPGWMAYPVDEDGTVGAGRQFADAAPFMKPGGGACDGLEVDEEGNVWAAGPGGVHVFAPDGRRFGRIVTGVKTGNLAFGGDGSVLYIAAGHDLVRLATGVRGLMAASGPATDTQTGQ